MKKSIFYSKSDREKARDDGVDSYWFTVIDDLDSAEAKADVNPWNGDRAFIREQYELLSDCLVSIRPAHSRDGYGNHDCHREKYFVEISDNSNGIKLSSVKIYSWDDVLNIVMFFKGLSFSAATRVWKAKKL